MAIAAAEFLMHHLILVRECDQQMSGSGCCGRLEGDLTQWNGSGSVFPERRERMSHVGTIHREVRKTFGDRLEITIVDPRNQISLVLLIIRDAFRYRVAPREVLRALLSSSLSTGILDGQLLYRSRIPPPLEVVDAIAGRIADPPSPRYAPALK